MLDCANGATYSVAPKVFTELGANIETIAANPDGININQNCGSTNPDFLKDQMSKGSYDMGIAFDGDGDRILIISSEGNILDGDDILFILSQKLLPNSGVVGTLMTNKALELHFQKNNIDFHRADVGDKYVLNELLNYEWLLGGEPSGHIICLDSAPTGDAIIAALKFLDSIKEMGFSIENSLKDFKKFPQTLINLKVDSPNRIIMDDKFWAKVTEIETQLGDSGRVLIRPSGTEPLIRLMVESKESSLSENLCNSLAELALNYMIIANWKMNGTGENVKIWIEQVSNNIDIKPEKVCVFCPPACYLEFAIDLIRKQKTQIKLGSQIINSCHDKALTGGLSATMLRDIDTDFVFIGHSEQRSHLREDSGAITSKITSAIEENLRVVFCIGEDSDVKIKNETQKFLSEQLEVLEEY